MNTVNHKNFLFKVLKVLDSNNIEYCLWGGTLLGAVRKKGFLVNDTKDTDIAVDEKYYWKIKRIFDKQVQSKKMKWHYLWRRELSVCSLDGKIKVDVFFLEKKNEDKGYIYSYTPNCDDKKWNHEWRMTFDSNDFFPTKKMKFFKRMVKIPNNKEKLLEELYGDWKTPDSTWKCEPTSYSTLDVDYKGFFPAGIHPNDYKINNEKYKYAYAMTTIARNNCAKQTIKSIVQHCPEMKIYVADQNEPTSEMYLFYEKYNVEYYFVEPNSGLSRNRNFLVDKIKEDYVFIGDDDFTFDKDSNIKIMQCVLDENPNIGIVGGRLINSSRYNKRLIWDNKKKLVYIIQIDNEVLYTKQGHKFLYTDLVLNFFLAKKEALKDCRWDNDLKLAEHLEYFLRFKETKWKVAYTPDVVATHDRERHKEYLQYRSQSKKYYKIMLQKYKMASLDNIISLENTPLNICSVEIPPDELFVNKEIKKIPVVNKKENKNPVIKVIDIKTKSNINSFDLEKLICEKLKGTILLYTTCLQAIKKRKLFGNQHYIGVTDNNITSIKNILTKNNFFEKSDNLFERNGLSIRVQIYTGKTKTYKCGQYTANVPFPVVSYLETTFGKDWRIK